ncbi:class I SAM-dependent methyltransferase [Streptomyces sp. NPDC059639]|uniref:class I SAM-dependent methyltransferase n=1 Tax=Streptomyces sp. NPDC059639 TaxID=3346891 RepID=UPI0036A6784A
MATPTRAGTAVGHVVFEEIRTSAPDVAQRLIGALGAELRRAARPAEGFVSARLHLGTDKTTVVLRVEWEAERHAAAAAARLPRSSALSALSDEPGVLSCTSFTGTPERGIAGPAADRAAGLTYYARRHTDDPDKARAVIDLLSASGRWKQRIPGFIDATPYLGADGTTLVNYPQWVSPDAFHRAMEDPHHAQTQDRLALLESAPATLVACTPVEQIDAAPAPPRAARAEVRSTGSLTSGTLSPLTQVRLFEQKYDPSSVQVLEGLGVDPAWRCLELGAGAGSMSRWLAARVPHGEVLAVDADTRFLDADRAANLTVREDDIDRLDFPPRSFDLVFARATLEHLRDPDEILVRARDWLAPGGWLVVGDFYYLPDHHAPTAVGRTLLRGYLDQMLSVGADMHLGRRLPAALARAGLTSIGSRLTPAGPGQSSADDELIGLRMRQEGQRLVAGGLVTADELTEFLDLLGTPGGRDLTALLVTAWGRRPRSSDTRQAG